MIFWLTRKFPGHRDEAFWMETEAEGRLQVDGRLERGEAARGRDWNAQFNFGVGNEARESEIKKNMKIRACMLIFEIKNQGKTNCEKMFCSSKNFYRGKSNYWIRERQREWKRENQRSAGCWYKRKWQREGKKRRRRNRLYLLIQRLARHNHEADNSNL